jgi:hypothetical protein
VTEKDYLQIAQSFKESKYFISAVGHRQVEQDELVDVLKILNEVDPSKITETLNSLYKYHPKTIGLNRGWRKSNCNMFNENCDCFLPDMDFDECYCQRFRKEQVLNHDRRNYKEYFEWRTEVFKRDCYTCQECGQVGGKLNAHHIKSYKNYPKLRVETSNGVTLCEVCHRKRHKKHKRKMV